jgi:hypothetical protein
MKKERMLHRTIVGTVSGILLLALSASAQNVFFSSGGGVYEIATNGAGSTFVTYEANSEGLAFDSAGDLFVARNPDMDGIGEDDIFEITTNRTQKVFSTTVKYPAGLAFNSAGDLFEADNSSGNIYEFTNHNGVLVSNLTVFASGLNKPCGLAFDPTGNLFEADEGSSNIYEFTTNGIRTTFASGLSYPLGLAFDYAGHLLEADSGSSNIYEFTTNGIRTIFASGAADPTALAFNKAGILFEQGLFDFSEIMPNGTRFYLLKGNQNGGIAGLAFPGITLPVSAPATPVITAQNLFVVSSEGEVIEITPGGTQTTFATGLRETEDIAFDSSGNSYITSFSGVIYGFPSGGIQGSFASLDSSPETTGLAFNSAGILFVANKAANGIIEILPNGTTNIFASGLNNPYGLAFDRTGDLFEADVNSGLIYEFTNNNGTLSTNLTLFASGLSYPWSLAFNSTGDLFETDYGSGNVYEFTPGGTRSTFASVSFPYGLAFEPVPVLQATASNGTTQITVTMPSPYYSTIVLASPDLVNWTPICTNTPPFKFTNSSPASSYFYRAVLNASLY